MKTKEILDKLQQGGIHRRIITYCGHRVMEHFQPNKEVPEAYQRHMLPVNGDKSKAIMHNYCLSIEEVKSILTTLAPEKLSIAII